MAFLSKTNLIPLLIIGLALIVGGFMFFGNIGASQTVAESSQQLRILHLSIPGMSCAGCAASIEGYVKAMPGVVSASASLSTKSGEVIYDPNQITKEEIIQNTIFDVYPPQIISDEPYISSS